VSAVVAAASLLAAGAAAQTIDYKTARFSRRVTATRATGPITIDGRLDDEAWRDAPIANGFIQSDPREGEPATFDTDVKVLYDEENVYFGAFNRDDEPEKAIANELRKDFQVIESDLFGVVIDTFHDERNGYMFEVNPMGARWDAQCFNDSREVNANWDGVWFVETSLGPGGWFVEMRIPLRTLKFTSASPQTWGMNFLRRNRRINEDSFWAPLQRFDRIHRVSLAGTLEGLEGLQPGNNIRVKPYASTSASTVGSGGTDGDADVGVDAKFGVTSGLTWDFTLNTDFSQVEADEQQVNLTRFSLFFPEKRDFFLENSGVFQFGPADARMFFSRRIGLSAEGAALPIWGGTRLTGRTGPYNIGVLNIQQREQPGARGAPATNFTALRLRRNILQNSDVGVLFLNKAVSGGDYNRTAGIDGNFRFFRNLLASAFVAKTFAPAGRLAGEGGDLAVNAEATYRDNLWDFGGSFMSIGERFNNELGYIPRVGMDKAEASAGLHLRSRRFESVMRETFPNVAVTNIVRTDGQLDSRYVNYRWPTTLQDGTNIEYGLNANTENLVEPFTISSRRGVRIQPGRYAFNEQYVSYRGNQSAKLALTGRVAIGDFYDGGKRTYQAGATARVNVHLTVALNWTHNDIDLPAGAYNTNLVSTRIVYGFTTTQFLNALIQYNTDANQWTSNIRFNIIHRPLSDFFLVYNDQRDSRSGDLINRAVIAKLTYMMQF
jgi:hypothetical protein